MSTRPLKCIDQLKEITAKIVEDLGYCIDTNVADDEDDNTTMSPLVIPFTQTGTKTKFVGLLQKIAKNVSDLTASLDTLSRSNMIYNIRSVGDNMTLLKTDGKPDDLQEPQGYINLGDCIHDETKTLFKTTPLTFQIATKLRVYLMKGKDDRSIEQFLTLIRPRIKSLNVITLPSLGNTKENLDKIRSLLPTKMRLPDRVKPDSSTKWIVEMNDYFEAYREWEPYLMKIEQFSEICHGEIKDYIDWFVSSEGPRLSMIRCEELVLDNWTDYIKKTAQEIATYEETRFFKEDFEEIIQHTKNMVMLVDSYNLYMRECHKTVKHVDKYLEEKATFLQYNVQFEKTPSRHSITFSDSTEGAILSAHGGGKYGSDARRWSFAKNVLTCSNGDTNLHQNGDRADHLHVDWKFHEGAFSNSTYGNVLWNLKTWVWSHPKTDYKIRFDWDNINQSHKVSISKKPHPDTVYADWKVSSNNISAVVVGNKAEPSLKSLDVSGQVPIPALLIAAMFSHIQGSLELLGIIDVILIGSCNEQHNSSKIDSAPLLHNSKNLCGISCALREI
eukprot:gene18016-21501_t